MEQNVKIVQAMRESGLTPKMLRMLLTWVICRKSQLVEIHGGYKCAFPHIFVISCTPENASLKKNCRLKTKIGKMI